MSFILYRLLLGSLDLFQRHGYHIGQFDEDPGVWAHFQDDFTAGGDGSGRYWSTFQLCNRVSDAVNVHGMTSVQASECSQCSQIVPDGNIQMGISRREFTITESSASLNCSNCWNSLNCWNLDQIRICSKQNFLCFFEVIYNLEISQFKIIFCYFFK